MNRDEQDQVKTPPYIPVTQFTGLKCHYINEIIASRGKGDICPVNNASLHNQPTLRFFHLSLLLIIGILLFNMVACCRAGNINDTVRVAGVILKWIPRDREANFRRIEPLIREAAAKGAKVICTPESFLDGYSARFPDVTAEELRSLAEEIPGGDYFSRLQKLSDELDIYLVAAITELDGEEIYNSAALIGPDGMLVGKYRKKFLWVDEVDKYTPGKAFPVFMTEFGKVGFMICSDRRWPEAIEELKKNGADFVLCPAGGGYGKKNDMIVGQRSKEGNIPIVFVHPVEFLVTGPSGKILKMSLIGNQLDGNKKDLSGGVVLFYDLPIPGEPSENMRDSN
ncbi:MAG: carbon-nitrogen hydrolase family protein [Candidatus Zixiibacteriota bacterium]|nr:MAG: carbon-nitrogen hydrolase family protein [candidate division Zixibacteria bacterium]